MKFWPARQKSKPPPLPVAPAVGAVSCAAASNQQPGPDVSFAGPSDAHKHPGLPRTLAAVQAARAEIMGQTRDMSEMARMVLELIRRGSFDIVYTTAEIDDWISHWADMDGINLELVRLDDLRRAIKCQPGVKYCEVRIRSAPQYAILRRRMVRERGNVPEKCWVYHITPGPDTSERAPERVSAVVIAKEMAAGHHGHSGQGGGQGDQRSGPAAPDGPAPVLPRSQPESPAGRSGGGTGVRSGAVPESVPESAGNAGVVLGFVRGSSRVA